MSTACSNLMYMAVCGSSLWLNQNRALVGFLGCAWDLCCEDSHVLDGVDGASGNMLALQAIIAC